MADFSETIDAWCLSFAAGLSVRRVRKLPSGRFQARYPGPDGLDRPAPHTFATKKDAEQWLVLKEAEIRRGELAGP